MGYEKIALILFDNQEAYLQFLYTTKELKVHTSLFITLSEFCDKKVFTVFLNPMKIDLITSELKTILNSKEDILIINNTNNGRLNYMYIDLFSFITSKKNVIYFNNLIHSCSFERLNIALQSILEEKSVHILQKNYNTEYLKALEDKKSSDYMKKIQKELIGRNENEQILMNLLLVTYIYNNYEKYSKKNLFNISNKHCLKFEEVKTIYTKSLSSLKYLFEKGDITYPFYDDVEILNEVGLSIEEINLMKQLTQSNTNIEIDNRDALDIFDLIYAFHFITNILEEDHLINALEYGFEKNIFILTANNRLNQTRMGNRLYDAFINEDLENFLKTNLRG